MPSPIAIPCYTAVMLAGFYVLLGGFVELASPDSTPLVQLLVAWITGVLS